MTWKHSGFSSRITVLDCTHPHDDSQLSTVPDTEDESSLCVHLILQAMQRRRCKQNCHKHKIK